MEIDRQTIKALSADTRIRILKTLHENRRIAADISRQLGLAPSTVNEHLKMMETAGLIRKKDDGHKWIYYEISEKGRNLIRPKIPINIILTLSLGIGLALFGIANYFTSPSYSIMENAASSMTEPAQKTASDAAGSAQQIVSAQAINWLPIILAAVGLLLSFFAILRIMRANRD